MANFTMSATLKAKPEYRDKIIEIMKSPKGVVVGREAKGNIFFDISLDDQDPNLFRAYENWHTKEEWEAFMQLKDQDGVLIATHGIDFDWLSEPPVFNPGTSLG